MKEFLEDQTSSQTRHAGTRSRIKRRTVYVGTVVAILAMVGGFALATLTTSTISNTGQNGYVTSSGNTIWTGTPSLAPSSDASACTTSVVVGFSTTSGTTGLTATQSAYVAGTSAGCNVASGGDFAEKFTLVTGSALVTCTGSASPCTSTQSDTFYTYANAGTLIENNVVVTYTFTGATVCASPGCTGTATLDLYVDFGTANPPASLPTLYVVVQGS